MESRLLKGVVLVLLVSNTLGCGMLTHTEVGARALHWLESDEYKQIILKHQDAYQAGAPFPDWGYLCNQHDPGEDTHWQPFMHTAINYLHEKYPKPWGPDAEKFVAFLLGIEVHSESDIVWHWGPSTNRADDQGFLHAMSHAASTCHDEWNSGASPNCHDIGDTGADLLLSLRGGLDYITPRWFLPTRDLVEIYKRIGYNVTSNQLSSCMMIFYSATHAEKHGGGGLGYPKWGRHAPFLSEELNDWFSGGVDDMAINVLWKLRAVIDLIEGKSSNSSLRQPVRAGSVQSMGIPLEYAKDLPAILASAGIETVETETGHIFSSKADSSLLTSADCLRSCLVSARASKGSSNRGESCVTRCKVLHNNIEQMPISQISNPVITQAMSDLQTKADKTVQGPKDIVEELVKEWWDMIKSNIEQMIFTKSKDIQTQIQIEGQEAYAYLGMSIAKGDLNNDGIEDLVLGAPGTGEEGKPHRGAVYIYYGGKKPVPKEITQLRLSDASLILQGTDIYSRFGWAVAVVDINADGKNDLVVSAPTTGEGGKDVIENAYTKAYRGVVSVFLGQPSNSISLSPDITVQSSNAADLYSNHGYFLTSEDCDGDGFNDILIGSPFAANGGDQVGAAAVFLSSTKRSTSSWSFVEADWYAVGHANYEWFGYQLTCANKKVIVSAPGSRVSSDLQATGRVYGFSLESLTTGQPDFTLTGVAEFGKAGQAIAIGNLKGAKSPLHLAVAAPSWTQTNDKAIFAGAVFVAPLDSLQGEIKLPTVRGDLGVFTGFFGSQPFGRFGGRVVMEDMDNDGYDDLIVSEHHRSSVLTGAEEGAMYIWKGSDIYASNTVYEAYSSDFRISHNAKAGQFGKAMQVVDLNGDGKKDLVVSAPYATGRERLSGTVSVFYNPL
eukprot:GILK01001737.1.p1 GENE.GILK01001737.1~~GILK01001737.1.p1  ORF type:complete len:905 (-),score=147.51 GILK01001737.1:91-2769(-)